jgi:hypothetical protein
VSCQFSPLMSWTITDSGQVNGRAVMPKVITTELTEDNAVGISETSLRGLPVYSPNVRTKGRNAIALSGAKHGKPYRYADRGKATENRKSSALHEDRRRITVVVIPPPEKGWG